MKRGPYSRTDAVLDDWDQLRRAGVSRADAAARIGIRLESLERMLQRHRNDPRARLGQRREIHIPVRDEATGRWVG